MKQCRIWTLSLAVALAPIGTALAHAETAAPNVEQKIQRMEKDQEALLRKLQRDIQSMEDSPRKEELKARLNEIERRIRAPQDLYVSPNSKFTPLMAAYYERMKRRLEDCGTRHFPMRNAQKLHGRATAAITLDRRGRLVKTDIVDSSGERLIDRHIPKLVAASAPFGDLPAEIVVDRSRPYRNLIVVTQFAFTRDEKPLPDDLPEAERCRWP